MAREIKAATDLAVPSPPINDYKDRLVKLIPSEIITAYVTLKGLIVGSGVQGNKMVIGGTFTSILGFPAVFIGSFLLVIYTRFIPFVYKG